jgi:hypothetical protein
LAFLPGIIGIIDGIIGIFYWHNWHIFVFLERVDGLKKKKGTRGGQWPMKIFFERKIGESFI